MGIKLFSLYCVLFFSLYPAGNLLSSEYQEETTSLGNVVTGLEKEEAIEKFGSPASATNEVWHYVSPKEFYVYFPLANNLFIHIYPESCDVAVDFPLEYKVFAYLPDLKIEDITSSAQLTANDPQSFILAKPGTIVPKKTGELQILAKHKDIFSNPLYLNVKASGDKQVTQELLLSINVLPYKPKVTPGSKVDFVALGTYFKPQNNMYAIKEISDDVKWFTQDPAGAAKEVEREIAFTVLGKTKVFCKLRNLESDRQEVEVKDTISPPKGELMHITLLPEFVILSSGNTINFVAVASYDDGVRDVTSMVNWKIENLEILSGQGKGLFLLKSPGVAQLIAGLDNINSSSAKVISLKPGDSKKGSFVRLLDLQENKEIKDGKEARDAYKDLAANIKKDVEKISNDSIKEDKRLTFIKIIPDNLRIPLGEKKQVLASGVYKDDSEKDLTLLGEWVSSDKKIASVAAGMVSAVSPGEAKVYLKFRKVESAPALVTVEKPKLISIVISPRDSQITMQDKLNLKAEGHFSDSSIQDISPLVSWVVTNPGTIKIEKEGVVKPLCIGETQAHAEYSGIKSLPVNIRVIFTLFWLLKKIFIIILFLILCAFILLFVMYFMTKNEENKLLSYYKSPREFIISLYGNSKEILNIFGNKPHEVIAPLSYAKLIEERYSVKDNLFLKLTVKFEEAKYSTHVLQEPDVNSALNDYNNFLKEVFSKYDKFSLFFRYCSTLLNRMPLFIYYGRPARQI